MSGTTNNTQKGKAMTKLDMKPIESKLADALPTARRIAVDVISSMVAGNRHFASGRAQRVHVKLDGGYVREVAATFRTHVPDAGASGMKRYRVKFTERMERWRGRIS